MIMKESSVNLRLILEGCLNKNSMSQKKLYEYYFGFAMNIALRYGKNREESLEILNDGFLKVFKNIDRYDDKYPFKAWLHRIIVNTGIDHYRANKNQIKFLKLEDFHQSIKSTDPLPNVSTVKDILPEIQELSPAYRMVFNLYVMEEYKHHEIAELLDISVSTSKSNLARAKAKILKSIMKSKNRKIKSTRHG